MKLGSTHNHSTGSDGKLSPEEVVKKAIELEWDYVYFTDHYPYPKGVLKEKAIEYHDENFFNEDYIKEIKKLKEKYKNKIEVCFGAEFGWLEKYEKWFKEQIKKQNFEYVIGALHDIIDKNNKAHALENGKENWLKSAENFGGVKEFIKEYYKQIKDIINSGFFDCIGHLDYIKVYNQEKDLFKEDSEWYKKEVLEVLDLIKKNNLAIEINGGGIRKCGEQFPSLWILKQAKKREIPVTLGLDAHWQGHFNNKIMEELISIAKQAGYNSVVRFKNRKIIKIKI